MSKKQINNYILFEYQDWVKISKGLAKDKEGFKTFLDEVWQKYKEEQPEKYWRNNLENDEDIERKQPFLYFEGDKFKPKNYIGFIKYKDFSFNLYPKICEDEYSNKKVAKEQINQMILLWIQYSDNVILPKIETGVNEIDDCDFMELLIYQFAKYTSDLLSVSIYQHYEEISEETSFLKGKLNFNEYIKNCAMGKAHKFHCTYDSFEMNNKFNQVIKYVAKSFLNITNNDINTNYLNDIIFKLDEVDDVVCTYDTCEKVYINRFMGDFVMVLDYCKLFLKNSVTFNDLGEFNNYAFLFRTEVLFEDFISNFAAEKVSGFTITPQSQHALSKNGNFYIRPDLLIEKDGKINEIIDIKYKDALKKGVSNADIYQCVTYAVKLGCNDVTLLYPKFNSNNKEDEKFQKQITIELAKENSTVNLKFRFIECCPCNENDYEKQLENNITNLIEEVEKEKLCQK